MELCFAGWRQSWRRWNHRGARSVPCQAGGDHMRTEWVAKLTLPVGDRDHIQGPATAPITLVEYGDYQCPYCGQAYPIVKELQEQLGKRLRFVFRNFPLSTVHPHAEHAAEAAETAGAH